jgi:hypothetical protein
VQLPLYNSEQEGIVESKSVFTSVGRVSGKVVREENNSDSSLARIIGLTQRVTLDDLGDMCFHRKMGMAEN